MRGLVCLLLACVLVAGAAPRKKAGKKNSRARIAETAILDAQIRLARAHFSPGEIDGRPGDNYSRALRGFQQSRSLSVTGELDPATLGALAEDNAPLMKTYTITDEDAAGPYAENIPEDLPEQAKLPALSYSSIEEALSERFHISPGLLHRLNPSAKLVAGETLQVPDTGTAPEGVKASKIVIRKDGTLTVFGTNGKVVAQYPCSSGSEHDPLPIGTWKVTGVAKNPPFFYNPALFWDAKPDHTRAKIPAGPNNPVGVVWIDLSKEHYGIHGTPVPGNVGHTQSHGCIRLTNWDAQEVAGMVTRGTPVICEE